jgi:periplasmic divalent cation tolerance protein
MPSLLEVRTTFPDIDQAVAISRQLVQEGLVACVQLLPDMTSIYRWEGMLRHDSEVFCLMKTSNDHWVDLRSRLTELHPYETPEIMAVPISEACFKYSTWIRASLR